MNSVTITRFVAKSEIRRWPVLGTLVTRAGTLYIDRGNRRDAARINLNMAKALVGLHRTHILPGSGLPSP